MIPETAPIRRRMEAHGIDPDHPRYSRLDGFGIAGGAICPHCHKHDVELPNPFCELRVAELEEARKSEPRTHYCSWNCDEMYVGEPHGYCEEHQPKPARKAEHKPLGTFHRRQQAAQTDPYWSSRSPEEQYAETRGEW